MRWNQLARQGEWYAGEREHVEARTLERVSMWFLSVARSAEVLLWRRLPKLLIGPAVTRIDTQGLVDKEKKRRRSDSKVFGRKN